jgi:thymidylate synthase
MYQRSGDVGLGIPFNIASYSLLTIILAKHCGLEPGEFIHHIGNAHIYEEHEEALKTQILRSPKPFPTCFINQKYDNIGKYSLKDIIIKNYNYYEQIKMGMKV